MSADQQDDVPIRTPDQRLRVFVSSTLAELADERAAVARAISSLRLTPVLFELGARPRWPGETDGGPRPPLGATEGLRRRRSLRTWPTARRGEAELVSRVTQEIGDEAYADAFAAGTDLGHREAIALVRGPAR
jgi:hypothetical protein